MPPSPAERERQARPELRAVPTSSHAERRAYAPAAPVSIADYQLVRERIDALERLSLLRDIGVLSPEEFAAEKALVLRLPAEELLLDEDQMLPARGPSLLGRLFGWKTFLIGAAIGLGLSAYTAPQDLMKLADGASRLIG
jgi:hypothetical protein